ncbi:MULTISPECIES: transcription-repair coupling factor [unclassified Nitratiruptor]|uniref:transcription-repair coupling factor n=1 Tax=unclassified Nitratiruptor TaxID=2624044 RepID=UPI001916C702|nr:MULTISPECIES: transcription-repair coupling factor [unclassified Nitratiruptor]BCD60763.1 transcription-repair coupling factor [Nitratiruptor sp. YY08-10]BCD64695.1 transcription-repair coupling factor [Nitratiruptor sp. YY08-14]
MVARFYEYLKTNIPQILVVADEKEAQQASSAAKVLGIDHYILPDFRAQYGDDLRVFKEELDELFAVLNDYYHTPKMLIAPVHTIAKPMPVQRYFARKKIEFGDEFELESLKELLYQWGYTFVDIVESKGEASFRGDIVDIFVPNLDKPIRLSFFDTQIESIRYFDPQTQKSIKEELEAFTLYPAFLIQDEALQEAIEQSDFDVFDKDLLSVGFWVAERASLLEGKEAVRSGSFDLEELYSYEGLIPKEQLIALPIVPEAKEYHEIEVLDINRVIQTKQNKKIKVLVKSQEFARRSSIKELEKIEFIYTDAILNIEGPNEVILSLNKPKKRRAKPPSIVIDELQPGSYVVHEQHGIGIFKGLKAIEILGAKRDFVELEYAGGDKLLVPVENLDVLSRYIADSGSVAVVDKLGSQSFAKLKAKVKERLFEIAADIVKIAAQRELTPGKKIITPPDIALFQSHAGFEYTEDQKKAIDTILQRLSSGKVMDMLLSGDVGFGKTEVAMNAIYAVVKNGYQAAVVVPTTLLSAQHYESLVKRLEPFNISVTKIDRFVTAKEKKERLQALKEGTIDVVVGTHALFGAEFKNLGLVVIDEEHKFGVKQKEKLKAFSKDVHLLSMSATPIPRSLNMALSQLKDLSEIRTPPQNRKPVRTYVKEYQDKLVKEVILRELRRGGQVFYIYNSIAGIEEKKEDLQQLLPGKKILVLHSKIAAATTEKELLRFSRGEYDILLSTSIVESGIHMPNVNTIIVEGADRFGIADLHQLRGRVGRGGKEGFCYYLVEDKQKLTEEAKKRLIALESNSYLGSGAALAYYDLEIRGGGNIIGAQQSGHIKNIGYSLYLQMLEETITKLTKGEIEEEPQVELKLSVNAYISSEVVREDRLKLELYRRLAQVKEPEEIAQIQEEIEDRFGKLDSFTKNFLDLIHIKLLALEHGIKKISNYNQNITFDFGDKKEMIKARSKDDDDILKAVLQYLR